MGESDRKYVIGLQHALRRVFTNDHLVEKMHAILAQSTSDEQKYINAKRIAADLALVHPENAAPLYTKTQAVIQDLYDAHHHRTKHIADDPLFYSVPESVKEVIDTARDTAADAAAETVEVTAKSAVGGGLLASGALFASKVVAGALSAGGSFFSLPSTNNDTMKVIPTKYMKKFIKRVERGYDLDRMIDVYRSKTAKNPDDYRDGMYQLTNNDLYKSRLPPAILQRIETEFMDWQGPGKAYKNWPTVTKKRKGDALREEAFHRSELKRGRFSTPDDQPLVSNQLNPTPGPYDPPPPEPTTTGAPTLSRIISGTAGALAGAAGGLLVGGPPGAAIGAIGGSWAGQAAAEDSYQQTNKGQQLLPPSKAPPVPPPTVEDPRNNVNDEDSARLTAMKRDAARRARQAEVERLAKQKKQRDDEAEEYRISQTELPHISRDESLYGVPPTLDPEQAAWSAMQQLVTRATIGLSGAAAQTLLSAGGAQGLLGGLALGAAGVTLDGFNRRYAQDYGSSSYSARRGVAAGDSMFDSLVANRNPILAVQRGLNVLESNAIGERASSSVVDAFTKSGAAMMSAQPAGDQIELVNRGIQNYMNELGPFVVPHARM